MKKSNIFCAAFFICAFPVLASANIEGSYHCSGAEIGTKEHFQGTAILKKTGQTYSLKSSFDDGTTYSGTGIYDEKSHILSIAFINPKNPEETGVAVAKVNSDSSMSSSWTYLNKTDIGHSNCTRIKV